VLGKHLTKTALDQRMRRIIKEDSYVRRHRDGEALRDLENERLDEINKRPVVLAQREGWEKWKKGEEEAELKKDYPHEFANMCIAFEYFDIEKSLSQTLASHPEALAIALSTLRELNEPHIEQMEEWDQRMRRVREGRQNGTQKSPGLST
jgi:hypothetical protein